MNNPAEEESTNCAGCRLHKEHWHQRGRVIVRLKADGMVTGITAEDGLALYNDDEAAKAARWMNARDYPELG